MEYKRSPRLLLAACVVLSRMARDVACSLQICHSKGVFPLGMLLVGEGLS